MTAELPIIHGSLRLNPGLRTYHRETGGVSIQILMAKGYEDGSLEWAVTHIYDGKEYDKRGFHPSEEGDAFMYFLSAVMFWENPQNVTFKVLVRSERERVQKIFWATNLAMRRSTRPVRPREAS